MNNKESDSNNTNLELNNLYAHYFMRPENINEVYDKPKGRPDYAGFIGGFMYDAKNTCMYNKEVTIRSIYYSIPNLALSTFFDVQRMRPDLMESRKQEVAEILYASSVILSDVDKLKDVATKKRILYYFKQLAKETKDCEFSKDIAVLVAATAVKNNIATLQDIQIAVANKNLALVKDATFDKICTELGKTSNVK